MHYRDQLVYAVWGSNEKQCFSVQGKLVDAV
jgi:hypothetical protein